MGVFARLLRRSKATEETQGAEARAESAPAAEEGTAEEQKPSETGTAEQSAVSETDEAGGDGVDIPKQQSAEEVADSEAGESARTK
ncbi:hypothetical protein OG985_14425 [Streptomyces sp. NBC_00289]|uniref:hypothetical protein n=1 Tax=Streptomyces sp. NBC_00289 TaxID=2975703 RepID=UPI00324E8DE9